MRAIITILSLFFFSFPLFATDFSGSWSGTIYRPTDNGYLTNPCKLQVLQEGTHILAMFSIFSGDTSRVVIHRMEANINPAKTSLVLFRLGETVNQVGRPMNDFFCDLNLKTDSSVMILRGQAMYSTNAWYGALNLVHTNEKMNVPSELADAFYKKYKVSKTVYATEILEPQQRHTLLRDTVYTNALMVACQLYDSGLEDGDKVDIYHNGQLLETDVELHRKPFYFRVNLSQAKDNELQFVMKHPGKKPPVDAVLWIDVKGKKSNFAFSLDGTCNVSLRFIKN